MEYNIPFRRRQANDTNIAYDVRVINSVEVSDVILMAYLSAIAAIHTHKSYLNTQTIKTKINIM